MAQRKLTKAEEERIVKEMNKIQMKESLKVVFDITTKCFEPCVTNFRLRKLDNDEELCVYKCMDKHEKFAQHMAEHFAKISTAEGGLM